MGCHIKLFAQLPVAALRAVVVANLLYHVHASGAIIRVPVDYASVQEGLSSLHDSDTLWIGSGTYYENVIAPPIRFVILGELSPDSGANARPVIRASSLPTPDTTAVILLPMSARASIENLRLVNRDRYGIRSWADSIRLANCVIDSCFYGYRELMDSLGAYLEMANCSFHANQRACVDSRPGNRLIVTECTFDGSGVWGGGLVEADNMEITHCTFGSTPGRMLLLGTRGPFKVASCTFGPVTMETVADVVYLSGGKVLFSNNTLRRCRYQQHVVEIQSETGDSVDVTNNFFEECRQSDDAMTAQGVLQIVTPNIDLQRGALVARNQFTSCGSSAAVDDIFLAVLSPGQVLQNHFSMDDQNGLPSIYAGNPDWQPTPAVLRGNIWSDCGFACALGGTADARFNYWGDMSGPFHQTTNPFGSGDTLTGTVPFIPWLPDTVDHAGDQLPAIPNTLNFSVYPNPFNSEVAFSYAITSESHITLAIYDILGRKIETLFSERQSIGVHQTQWNAAEYASGIYFAKLSTPNGQSQSTKLLLLK